VAEDAGALHPCGMELLVARSVPTSQGSGYQGTIHDFVMLNALRETHAADAAIRQAISFLRQTLAAR
jgi:hypothetical protein